MHFVVCLEEAPDTESRIEARDGRVIEGEFQYVVNPYDEQYALEDMLKKEFRALLAA